VTTDDAELLEHYVRRGAAAFHLSLEAAWLDYELRSFVLGKLPARRPLAVCNVGIGVGLWDDWLARVIGAPITSVDRDPDVCRIFALRQARERHPFPSLVLCGDPCDGILGDRRFDVITVVGATLEAEAEAEPQAEAEQSTTARPAGQARADRGRLLRALSAALVPGGLLLSGEAGTGAAGDRVRTRGDLWLACQARTG
jgi:SAM-dependent methyltransferase